MCTYCMIGDWQFHHDPPWQVPPGTPFVPQPRSPAPVVPWDLDKLREYHDLLKRVKALEDALGCPCEPNKADYIGMFEKRIKALERKAAARKKA